MKINYKNIEISIFRNYEGEYGTTQEHLNTIKGDEIDTFDDQANLISDGVVDIEDLMDGVRDTLECAYTKDKLTEEK